MILWAHRGASAHAPENTLAAFLRAERDGAAGVELDVHLCATGELVVIHDYELARTTGLNATVETTPWSVIRELDAGAWKDPVYRGERVPRLGDVLDTLDPRITLDIEIKWTPGRIGPLETAVAEEIRRRGLGGRVLVSSFHPFSIRAVRKAAPALRTAVIYSGEPPMPFYLRRGQGRLLSGSPVLKPHHALIHPGLVERHRARGRELIPWTVDDPERARVLAAMGVTTVITNDPAALRGGV